MLLYQFEYVKLLDKGDDLAFKAITIDSDILQLVCQSCLSLSILTKLALPFRVLLNLPHPFVDAVLLLLQCGQLRSFFFQEAVKIKFQADQAAPLNIEAGF